LTKQTTYGKLESRTLGQLNDVGYFIPIACHFLNRLRLWICQ
jgi:hypothetical protein